MPTRRVQGIRLLQGEALQRLVDAPVQPAQNLAGATLHDTGTAPPDHGLDAGGPLDRAVDLLDQQSADALWIGLGTRVHIVHHGNVGRPDGDSRNRLGKALSGGLHQAGMERRAHRQWHGALGACRFEGLYRGIDRGGLPGDNDLAGGIEVDSGDDAFATGSDIGAGRIDHLILQADDCRHGALPDRYGTLHELPALSHQSHGIGKTQGARTDQCGKLTETVSRHDARPRTATGLPRPPQRNTRGQQDWLGGLSQVQGLLLPVLDEVPHVVTERIGGIPERITHRIEPLVGGCEHPDFLGALAGEDKRDRVFCHDV